MPVLTALHLDSPDSLKRAIASGLGFLCLLFVNPFLTSKGIPPVSDGALMSAAGVLTGYIMQSGLKAKAEAAAAGQAAAATVTTPADAAAVLGEVKP